MVLGKCVQCFVNECLKVTINHIVRKTFQNINLLYQFHCKRHYAYTTHVLNQLYFVFYCDNNLFLPQRYPSHNYLFLHSTKILFILYKILQISYYLEK